MRDCKQTLVCVGVAVVVALVGLAQAQAFEELNAKVSLPPMAKPAAKPVGYKWISLKNGEDDYILTKIAEKGGLETWKLIDGCSFTRPASELFATEVKWTSCSGPDGTQDVKLNGEVWPLQVGKTWSEDYSGTNDRGRTWSSTNKCTVESQVRVKVKAGEFDTYKVVCNDTWNKRISYISPERGIRVYYIREHSKRGGKYELVREELPK